MAERPWPSRVPARRRRPAQTNPLPALFGALIGGALTGGIGALVGGTAGLVATPTAKLSLDAAIRGECARLGVEVVSLERPAQGRISATVNVDGEFWTIESRCRYLKQLEQEDIDDWLFGDFVDHRLIPLLATVRA